MRLLDRARRSFEAHPLLADLALVAIVTAAAAALRLVLLGTIPYGLHPDEAQVGTDVNKILDGDFLGVYTHAALGQPSGHAYLSLPLIWLLPDTTFAIRITLALVAIAAVPLLYALVRMELGRAEAFFASALLALSYWHVFYSRVAHWSISYGTVVLAVLLCVMLGRRQRRRAWFFAGGALLGLGVYTYNIYPIAVVAVGVALLAITLVHERGERWRWWSGSMAAFWLTALVVAAPMIVYVANPGAYYWDHVDNYSEVGVLRSDEFSDASTGGKARIIAEQAGDFVAAYTYDAEPDQIDANGQRPVFDPLTLLLMAGGAAIAFWRRREPLVIAAVVCLIIIPLPAVLQHGSVMRQPVAAAPFAMLLAALPLALIWREGVLRGANALVRAGSALAVGAALAVLTTMLVGDYFIDWRRSAWTAYVYHAEITAASEYMADLPDDTYVYFFSERHPIYLETREFLAPDVEGEDRSSRFGSGAVDDVDRQRPVTIVLLDRWLSSLDQIMAQYPGGRVVEGRFGDETYFYAYELPLLDAAGGAPAITPP